MKYRIEDITPEGVTTTGEFTREWLEGLFQGKGMLEIACPSPLFYEMHLSRSENTVCVSGRIDLTVDLACSRCLEKFVSHINPDFKYSFLPAQSQELSAEKELLKEDLEQDFYSVDGVDIEEIIQEQISLAMPYSPLCREECKGLCPRCGRNKNLEMCSCPPTPVVDSRLAGLKTLLKNQ
ncbi:MAG: DUF177 domain-containing protein [Deltaproteobacteria bacterium]|nr:DUF177 domain-containing protein [Deltaproteobacteria bacterium]